MDRRQRSQRQHDQPGLRHDQQLGQSEVDRGQRGQRGQRQRRLRLEHGGRGGPGPITSPATWTRRRPARWSTPTSRPRSRWPPCPASRSPARPRGTLPRGRGSRSNGPRPMSRPGARSAWPTTRLATGATRSGSRSMGSRRPTARHRTPGTPAAWRPGPTTWPVTWTSRAGRVYSHLATAITITGPAPSFTLSGPASGTFIVGQMVPVQWTAANVPSGSTISLAYDTTSNWGNPKWIEVDAVRAADGSGVLQLEHGGPGARDLLHCRLPVYAVGGARWSTRTSRPRSPWARPTFTLTGPASGTFISGQTIPVQWTDANVPSGSTISLAYDTTSNWGNPTWIEVDGVERGQRQRLVQLEHDGPGGRDLLPRRIPVHAVVRHRGLLAPGDLVYRDRRRRPASRFPARPPAAYCRADDSGAMDCRQCPQRQHDQPGLRHDQQLGQPDVDRGRRGRRGQRQRLLQLENGGPGGRDVLHRRLHVHAVVRYHGLLAPHHLVRRDPHGRHGPDHHRRVGRQHGKRPRGRDHLRSDHFRQHPGFQRESPASRRASIPLRRRHSPVCSAR